MEALRNSKGFTLPELMVVIAIIAIMTGFGYSGFSALMKRERVKAAASQFAAHVKEARMMAIEKHETYSVGFSDSDGVYTIYRGTPCEPDTEIVRQVTLSDEYLGVRSDKVSEDFCLSFGRAGIDTGNTDLRSVTFLNNDGCYCEVKITAAGGIRIEEDPDCFH